MNWLLLSAAVLLVSTGSAWCQDRRPDQSQVDESRIKKITKTEAQWRQRLTSDQYEITRRKGTEQAFTGSFWNSKLKGTYSCVCCDLPLFESSAKFDSGTGWPSFFQPVKNRHVAIVNDYSGGMFRKEVICARCDAHLGHVFNDGPKPTGLRYCMNSLALKFQSIQKKDKLAKPQAADGK